MSLGMYSATSSLSSPSAQQPMRLTRRLCRTFPTPAASACGNQTREIRNGILEQIRTHRQGICIGAQGRGGAYEELLRVGPREAGEALDGDEAAAVEAAPVDDVGRLLAALGDDEVGAEALGGGPQLGEAELPEDRHRPLRPVLLVAVRAGPVRSVRRLFRRAREQARLDSFRTHTFAGGLGFRRQRQWRRARLPACLPGSAGSSSGRAASASGGSGFPAGFDWKHPIGDLLACQRRNASGGTEVGEGGRACVNVDWWKEEAGEASVAE